MRTIEHSTIFTNVALTDEGDVWWEGIGKPAPAHLIDWQGNDWSARFRQARRPPQRPLHRIRRAKPRYRQGMGGSHGRAGQRHPAGRPPPSTVPLVLESKDWTQGIFLGSIMGSEITAATISKNIDQVRRDPFAMLPFIGYNMSDYLQHWLDVADWTTEDKLPRIFHVNWFLRDENKRFMWPGFGDNIRVLAWAIKRLQGKAEGVETPLGYLPKKDGIDTTGLEVDMDKLLTIDRELWQQEIKAIREHYNKIPRMPKELVTELEKLEAELG